MYQNGKEVSKMVSDQHEKDFPFIAVIFHYESDSVPKSGHTYREFDFEVIIL